MDLSKKPTTITSLIYIVPTMIFFIFSFFEIRSANIKKEEVKSELISMNKTFERQYVESKNLSLLINSELPQIYDGYEKTENVSLAVERLITTVKASGEFSIDEGSSICDSQCSENKELKLEVEKLRKLLAIQVTKPNMYSIYFGSDNDDLTPQVIKHLKTIIKEQNKFRYLQVVGFTDSVGNSAYNCTLAAKRNNAITELINKWNNELNIVSVAVGEMQNQDKKGDKILVDNQFNRRVDLYFSMTSEKARTQSCN